MSTKDVQPDVQSKRITQAPLGDILTIAKEMKRLREIVNAQHSVICRAADKLGGVDLRKMRAKAKRSVTEAYQILKPVAMAKPTKQSSGR